MTYFDVYFGGVRTKLRCPATVLQTSAHFSRSQLESTSCSSSSGDRKVMECALDVSSASALALPCLDLSKRDMSELPEMEGCEHLRVSNVTELSTMFLTDKLGCHVHLQCLYLEGNRLSQLPPSLFSSCPHLQWLDLRNNRLTHLPQFIQRFR